MQAPKSEQTFEPAPAGNHVARLYSIINIGTIEEEYAGETKQINKIRFTFELCNKKKVYKDGEPEKPIAIGAEFTFSMGAKANLRKFVEGMLGKKLTDAEANELQVESLLGHACLLNVIHKTSKTGNLYALVQNASPLPEGIEAPAQANENFLLGYGDTWDQAKFALLPNFIKDKMMLSAQYKALNPPTVQLAPEETVSGDIPF